MKRACIGVALLWIAGCVTPFDAGERLFECKTKDDCAEGHECGRRAGVAVMVCVPFGTSHDAGAVVDVPDQGGAPDTPDAEVAQPPDSEPADADTEPGCDEASLQCPCAGDEDCSGGPCIELVAGKRVCSIPCVDASECAGAESFDCLPRVDGAAVCQPVGSALCRPCQEDATCGVAGSGHLCVPFGETSGFCGQACGDAGACPQGFECRQTGDGDDQCAPTGGECACPGYGPSSVEICNGQDDDCDGAIDEDVLCDDGVPCTQDVCVEGQGCQATTVGLDDPALALVAALTAEEVADTPALDLDLSTDAWTMSARVKMTDKEAPGVVFAADGPLGKLACRMSPIPAASDKWELQLIHDGPKAWGEVTLEDPPKWHHVAFVHDAAAGEYRVLFDGQVVGQGSGAPISLSSYGKLHIGSEPDGGSGFPGELDDVRVYKAALDFDEAGEPTTIPPPASNPCDDGLACTLDACDAETGACEHVASDAQCLDDQPCSADACDALTGCTHQPLTCDPNAGLGSAYDPTQPALGGHFGSALTVDGPSGAVGQPDAASGSVELLADTDGGWMFGLTLFPEGGLEGDRFGASVAMEGTRLAVGAPEHGVTGAVYIYEQNEGGEDAWGQAAKLQADFEGAKALGGAVAQSGGYVVAGDPVQSRVHVFEQKSGGGWEHVALLGDEDAAIGTSVAMVGDVVATGAPALGTTGGVFVYRKDADGEGVWVVTASLGPQGQKSTAGLGASVAMTADWLLAGAPATSGGGAALIWRREFEDLWAWPQKLAPQDLAADDGFGAAVSLRADLAVVGAKETVYLYARNGDSWFLQQKLATPDPGVAFGAAVAINADTLLVGAPNAQTSFLEAGTLYVHPLPVCPASLCTGATACDHAICLSGACGTQPVSCDDSEPCTADGCDDADGCSSLPKAGDCDDGDPCTAPDACLDGACAGTPMICNDGIDCTMDACDPVDGCTFTEDGSACTDGNACTDDVCTLGAGCSNPPNAAPCDDSDKCTTADVCVDGACTGAPKPCSDGDACTDDTCDPASGDCTSEDALPGWAWTHDTPDGAGAARAVLALTDGGAVAAGFTTEGGYGLEGRILGVDVAGKLQWSTPFAGKDAVAQELNDVIAVTGGYVAVGSTGISGSPIVRSRVIRTDEEGIPADDWPKDFGTGSWSESLTAVVSTPTGLALVGRRFRPTAGDLDARVRMVNADTGAESWSKDYGGTGNDAPHAAILVGDRIIVVGDTSSLSAGAQGANAWLLDIHLAAGQELASKAFGGPGEQSARDVVADGAGFIIAGYRRPGGARRARRMDRPAKRGSGDRLGAESGRGWRRPGGGADRGRRRRVRRRGLASGPAPGHAPGAAVADGTRRRTALAAQVGGPGPVSGHGRVRHAGRGLCARGRNPVAGRRRGPGVGDAGRSLG